MQILNLVGKSVAVEILKVGGVFGAALLLGFPALNNVLKESRGLGNRARYKLLNTSLYVVGAIVLLSGGLWAFKQKTPAPNTIVKSSDCSTHDNQLVIFGDNSSASVCNQGVMERPQAKKVPEKSQTKSATE